MQNCERGRMLNSTKIVSVFLFEEERSKTVRNTSSCSMFILGFVASVVAIPQMANSYPIVRLCLIRKWKTSICNKSSQQQEGLKLSRCGAWQQKLFGLREQLRNSFWFWICKLWSASKCKLGQKWGKPTLKCDWWCELLVLCWQIKDYLFLQIVLRYFRQKVQ